MDARRFGVGEGTPLLLVPGFKTTCPSLSTGRIRCGRRPPSRRGLTNPRSELLFSKRRPPAGGRRRPDGPLRAREDLRSLCRALAMGTVGATVHPRPGQVAVRRAQGGPERRGRGALSPPHTRARLRSVASRRLAAELILLCRRALQSGRNSLQPFPPLQLSARPLRVAASRDDRSPHHPRRQRPPDGPRAFWGVEGFCETKRERRHRK